MDLHMWLTFAIIVATVSLYVSDRISIELTSLGAIVAYLALFTFLPLTPAGGAAPLGATKLLAGFADPALLTVLALLVVGQGLFQTDALDRPAQWIARLGRRNPALAVVAMLLIAGAISAFLNNTPVVVMFVPIVSTVAAARGVAAAKVLMPLSFISIFGGMTTLIGSSTNLLVAGVAKSAAGVEIGFFSQSALGLCLAAVGALYALFAMPRLLTARASMAQQIEERAGKQFIAEIRIDHDHPLVGAKSVSGMFPALKDMTLRLVQRGSHPFLPPFEDLALAPGDTVIVAATRQALTRALSTGSASLEPDGDPESAEPRGDGRLMLAEVVVAPGSRMSGRTIEQSGVHAMTGAVILGVQRRSRMPRQAMTDIRLESGDVLLVCGSRDIIEGLRSSRDLLLLEWSATEMPQTRYAPRAQAIFALMVLLAGTAVVPIVVAALAGALGMLLAGCINMRQAIRVLDSRIYMLIGASLASATALEATGGAGFLAGTLVRLLDGQSPLFVLSSVFLLVALLTNLLSNNATAVLFTPIAIGIAGRTGVDPQIFVVTVILAANCSFATPFSYQTNLLVMGPGHYRFSDYMVAGGPLILLMWLTFTLAAPLVYSLS